MDDMPGAGRSLRILTEAAPSVMALCTPVGAWLLWRLLRDVAAGRPFHPRNPVRIGGLATLILIGAIAGGPLQNIATAMVLRHGGLQLGEPPFRELTIVQGFPARSSSRSCCSSSPTCSDEAVS